jgi:hypothetical protein
MRTSILSACAALIVGLSLSLAAVAADAPALRVIVVETTDLKAYLHELDNLRAIAKKNGTPLTLRVWRARFAGSSAGAIVVSAEYPSFAALAKADDLLGNPEYAATMQRIAGLRKIVSDSIYEEIGR